MIKDSELGEIVDCVDGCVYSGKFCAHGIVWVSCRLEESTCIVVLEGVCMTGAPTRS